MDEGSNRTWGRAKQHRVRAHPQANRVNILFLGRSDCRENHKKKEKTHDSNSKEIAAHGLRIHPKNILMAVRRVRGNVQRWRLTEAVRCHMGDERSYFTDAASSPCCGRKVSSSFSNLVGWGRGEGSAATAQCGQSHRRRAVKMLWTFSFGKIQWQNSTRADDSDEMQRVKHNIAGDAKEIRQREKNNEITGMC